MRAIIHWAQNSVDADLEPYITKSVMGGKGANLALMCQRGYPVPPGFTITTPVCHAYWKNPEAVMKAVAKDIPAYLDWLKTTLGYMPLVSVRSGAPVSMPGMMDTVLNVGLCEDTLPEWEQRIGKECAHDSYLRLHKMYGDVVLGIPKAKLDEPGVSIVDTLAQAGGLPQDPVEQIMGAVKAVFDSWNCERAKEYRKLNNIPDDMGTAVNIQAMVFGNMGETSGTGVLFTRNPATGEKVVTGEFLRNAQGEDVVAGTHTPVPLLATANGAFLAVNGSVVKQLDTPYKEFEYPFSQLLEYAKQLELEARDMQDIEFTIQEGKLWLLQTRSGKRSASAAFVIARDLLDEGMIKVDEARSRLTLRQFEMAMRPTLNRDATITKLGGPHGQGLAGSVGVAVGRVVYATGPGGLALIEQNKLNGHGSILVAEETTPDHIAMMAASVGILTAKGGFTSHAAVVARGMDKPCITACELAANHAVLTEGTTITLDASTGEVWLGEGVVSAANASVCTGLIRRFMDHAGLRLRTSDPEPGAYCVAADAIAAGTSVAAWAIEASKMDNATIDLRGPDGWLPKADVEFLSMVGGDRTKVLADEAVNALIAQGVAPPGARVLLPEGIKKASRVRLSKLGYDVVDTAVTLDDALSATSSVRLGEPLRAVAGSDWALSHLTEFLKSKGIALAPENEEGASIIEAARTLLAA